MNIIELKQNEISVVSGGSYNNSTVSQTSPVLKQHLYQIGSSCLAEACIALVNVVPDLLKDHEVFGKRGRGGKALAIAAAAWGAFSFAQAATIWVSALAANAFWSMLGH